MIYAVKYNPEVNRTQVLGDQEITQSELPIPEVLCRELVSLLKDLPSSFSFGIGTRETYGYHKYKIYVAISLSGIIKL